MSNKLNGYFTSESVSEGHPDKVADLIADRILDACIAQDPDAHVALEVQVGRGYVFIGGNVTTTARVDMKAIARETLKMIGYDAEDTGASADHCVVIDAVDVQSSDINNGVTNSLESREGDALSDETQGAGDQGMMFGYASNETKAFMPLAIAVAHKLVEHATLLRKQGILDWALPDMKSQVTVEYKDGFPVAIDTVVMSVQHRPWVSNEKIREDIVKTVIVPVLQHFNYAGARNYIVNPSGRFVIGGPEGDVGVVGRKIIVDTYGGYCPHGGGAFSGKDPSKVDRSGAYAARYIAKNIVAAGLADRAQVQVAYAIGKARPVSIHVDTFGTGTVRDDIIGLAVEHVFNLTPKGILRTLDLKTPIYEKTTNYGHFGKENCGLAWEKTDKIVDLLNEVEKLSAVKHIAVED